MENRKTVRKWFWVWDFEKEEDWLNEMALNGWVLDDIGWCTYHFVRCEPGEYSVRLEMHPHDEEYVGFMKETGAEYLGRMVAWIYFRKKTADGPFDLFSDIDSRISHLNKIGKTLAIITLVKDTALASVVVHLDLFTLAKGIVNVQAVLWPIFYAGLFYLIFNGVLTVLLGKLEKKLEYFKV